MPILIGESLGESLSHINLKGKTTNVLPFESSISNSFFEHNL
jgi:hypothetical protein